MYLIGIASLCIYYSIHHNRWLIEAHLFIWSPNFGPVWWVLQAPLYASLGTFCVVIVTSTKVKTHLVFYDTRCLTRDYSETFPPLSLLWWLPLDPLTISCKVWGQRRWIANLWAWSSSLMHGHHPPQVFFMAKKFDFQS